MIQLSLNGRWQLSQRQADPPLSCPAEVPGSPHTALLAAGLIPDPFYRDNELAVQWVGEADWIFERTVTLSPALLAEERLELVCHGLDTLAEVWWNGRLLGRADNMFRSWRFDLKPHAQVGENRLVIYFQSAVTAGQAKLAERPLPAWGIAENQKIAGGNAVRKAQSHFGWDWGPKLVTCGIWREIELVASSGPRLEDVHIRQTHHPSGAVTLTLAATLSEMDAGGSLGWEIALAGAEVYACDLPLSQKEIAAEFTLDAPELWWPNGLGEQPLYTVRVRLGREVWERHIGLRTLELVREPDQWGESFFFRCNGVPFFAKGANWIPADSLPTRLTPAWYRQLLEAAAAAHINMLRVWGGGFYEDPVFYELCDQLGICVWQDFMFACATYPTFDPDFISNVTAEAVENIQRLRHHACLALWCGNNELEQGLVDDAWGASAMSWADYRPLFDELLAALVAKHDGVTPYWPASPHTPVGDRLVWNDPRSGDAHIWDVWHGMEPFEFYRTCEHRFNSEFGFQSFPEPRTLAAVTLPEERNITSRILEHHQKNAAGNSKIIHYLLDWFRLPVGFENTVWLSQILQGMAMKYAVEHWRRSLPRGMGTLYWQLNDCWPVASWSSLDYYGRWKALHHLARRFYAPLLLSGVEDWASGRVEVHLTNDLREMVRGELSWRLRRASGEELRRGMLAVDAVPLADSRVAELHFAEEMAAFGGHDLLLFLDFRGSTGELAQDLVLFARPKHLTLRDPQIKWEVEGVGNGRYALTLISQAPALWVWLTHPGQELTLSDNFVHLEPGLPRQIQLQGDPSLTPHSLREGLQIRSLVDTYRE